MNFVENDALSIYYTCIYIAKFLPASDIIQKDNLKGIYVDTIPHVAV